MLAFELGSATSHDLSSSGKPRASASPAVGAEGSGRQPFAVVQAGLLRAIGPGVAHLDVAQAAGVSLQLVRQARLDSDNRNYRAPPSNWREVVARLARERARELERLAEELEG